MFADNRIVHESDVNLLPEGATVIKSVYESTYEQISYIVQHDYEMIIYKDKDGNMRKGYFPKEKLLAKGAVVNCDETWCRVKVNGKYGKKYIWCMVNKEAKVAVYFYDDGSRGRKVLRDFLGETEIDALQSDGFRSSYAGLLPSGRKNLLPMTIGIKK